MIELALLAAAALGSRGCLPLSGDRIAPRDLAAAIPAFAQLADTVSMGFAPVAGARRYFSAAELQRLARAHGLRIEANSGLCLEWPLAPLSREDISAAMSASLAAPGARIEILETSRYPVPRGELVFPRASLTAPASPSGASMWRGYVRYGASRKFAVWARVKVAASVTRIIAMEPLRSGEPIRHAQIREESYEGFPAASAETSSLDEVAGQVPRRPIAAGKAIRKAALARPHDVVKGEMVAVEAGGAAMRVTVEARAEAPGQIGQVIPVRNLASGKTFRGRVAGRARVVVGAPAGKGEVE